jgi:hypothetical protein
MGNTNWNAVINVADVRERNVGGGFVEPVTGAYKVRITETEQYEKDGKTSVKFQTVIAEGEFAGSETRLFIGLDMSKDGNKRSWKTALLSIGIPADQVDAGNVSIGAETFKDAEAFIYYKAKNPDDATSQSDRQFITPTQYANLTSGKTAGATAAPAATATVAAKSLNGSAPAMSVPAPTGAAARLRGMAASRQ